MDNQLVFAVLIIVIFCLIFKCTCDASKTEGLASSYSYTGSKSGPDPAVSPVTDTESQGTVTNYNFGTGSGQILPYGPNQTMQDAKGRTVNYKLKKVYRPINTSAPNSGNPKYGGQCYPSNSQMVVQLSSGLDNAGNYEASDFYSRDCEITSTIPDATSSNYLCTDDNKKRYPFPSRDAVGNGAACSLLTNDERYGPATTDECGNRNCEGSFVDDTCSSTDTPPTGYDCVDGKLVNINTGMIRQKYVISKTKLGTGTACTIASDTRQDSTVRGADMIDCAYTDWQYAI
jgi:hypothetical protein